MVILTPYLAEVINSRLMLTTNKSNILNGVMLRIMLHDIDDSC